MSSKSTKVSNPLSVKLPGGNVIVVQSDRSNNGVVTLPVLTQFGGLQLQQMTSIAGCSQVPPLLFTSAPKTTKNTQSLQSPISIGKVWSVSEEPSMISKKPSVHKGQRQNSDSENVNNSTIVSKDWSRVKKVGLLNTARNDDISNFCWICLNAISKKERVSFDAKYEMDKLMKQITPLFLNCNSAVYCTKCHQEFIESYKFLIQMQISLKLAFHHQNSIKTLDIGNRRVGIDGTALQQLKKQVEDQVCKLSYKHMGKIEPKDLIVNKNSRKRSSGNDDSSQKMHSLVNNFIAKPSTSSTVKLGNTSIKRCSLTPTPKRKRIIAPAPPAAEKLNPIGIVIENCYTVNEDSNKNPKGSNDLEEEIKPFYVSVDKIDEFSKENDDDIGFVEPLFVDVNNITMNSNFDKDTSVKLQKSSNFGAVTVRKRKKILRSSEIKKALGMAENDSDKRDNNQTISVKSLSNLKAVNVGENSPITFSLLKKSVLKNIPGDKNNDTETPSTSGLIVLDSDED